MVERPVSEVTRNQPVRPVSPDRERQPVQPESNPPARNKKTPPDKTKPDHQIDDFA